MNWFVDKLGPVPGRTASNATSRPAPQQQPQKGAAPKSAPAPQSPPQRAAAPPPAPEPEKKKKKGWF